MNVEKTLIMMEAERQQAQIKVLEQIKLATYDKVIAQLKKISQE